MWRGRIREGESRDERFWFSHLASAVEGRSDDVTRRLLGVVDLAGRDVDDLLNTRSAAPPGWQRILAKTEGERGRGWPSSDLVAQDIPHAVAGKDDQSNVCGGREGQEGDSWSGGDEAFCF